LWSETFGKETVLKVEIVIVKQSILSAFCSLLKWTFLVSVFFPLYTFPENSIPLSEKKNVSDQSFYRHKQKNQRRVLEGGKEVKQVKAVSDCARI
jgi:hypothetical protein